MLVTKLRDLPLAVLGGNTNKALTHCARPSIPRGGLEHEWQHCTIASECIELPATGLMAPGGSGPEIPSMHAGECAEALSPELSASGPNSKDQQLNLAHFELVLVSHGRPHDHHEVLVR